MKKTLMVLTAAFAAFVLGAPQTASAETLRVGMECTYPPFNFKKSTGELDGYDVDVAKGVAKRPGWTPTRRCWRPSRLRSPS